MDTALPLRSMPEFKLLLAQILESRQVRKRMGWNAALYQLRGLGPDRCVEIILRTPSEEAQKIAISKLFAAAQLRHVNLLCTVSPKGRSVFVQVVCNWIPSECDFCGVDLSVPDNYELTDWDCVCKSCCRCYEAPKFLQRPYGKWVVE